jgi:hypothetical protein
MIMDGNISDEKLPVTISNWRTWASSKQSYSDPDIGTVLRWHIEICAVCHQSLIARPAGFGRPAKVFCSEYWEIIQEYSEYERLYAQMGNP